MEETKPEVIVTEVDAVPVETPVAAPVSPDPVQNETELTLTERIEKSTVEINAILEKYGLLLTIGYSPVQK